MSQKIEPVYGCLVKFNIDAINRDPRCDISGNYNSDNIIVGIFNRWQNNDKSEVQVYHISPFGGINLMRIKTQYINFISQPIFSKEFLKSLTGVDIKEELCKFGKPEDIYPPFKRLKQELIQDMEEEDILSKIGISKMKEHVVRCLMALDAAEERLNQIKSNEDIPDSNGQYSESLEPVVNPADFLQEAPAIEVKRGFKEQLKDINEFYTSREVGSNAPEIIAPFIPTKNTRK